MDPFAELLAGLAPPGVTYEPTRMAPWLIDRVATMGRWADQKLTGARRALFDDFIERERLAGMHGMTLKRKKGTPNPWDMNTPDEVASEVYYYQVPWESDDDYQWRSIWDAMSHDSRLTQELAIKMKQNAAALASATEPRKRILEDRYRQRFESVRATPGGRFSRSAEWERAGKLHDEFKGDFDDK